MRIRLEKVGKKFGDLWAVKDVTISILPNKITALVGPNGAGKTTLFHIIAGELKPDEGKIYLEDGEKKEDITGLPPWKIAGKGIGRLFQEVRIFKKLTVLENVCVALQEKKEESPFRIILNPLLLKKKKYHIEEAMGWLEFVGLEKEKDKYADELSFGQQKLLSIARLMAGGFNVLLLDEPTAGLHPEMVRKIEELLRKMVEEKKTLSIIEHNLTTILKIADWVYFMNEGKVAFFGKPDHVLGEREVKETYIGI
jgi:ABC-type branched-subunit amino acid transport system ATPase component